MNYYTDYLDKHLTYSSYSYYKKSIQWQTHRNIQRCNKQLLHIKIEVSKVSSDTYSKLTTPISDTRLMSPNVNPRSLSVQWYFSIPTATLALHVSRSTKASRFSPRMLECMQHLTSEQEADTAHLVLGPREGRLSVVLSQSAKPGNKTVISYSFVTCPYKVKITCTRQANSSLKMT